MTAFLELTLFFFVLLGSKIVMGIVAVYMLLPRDAACTICDAETLPIEHPRGTDRVLRWMRLQRRWCMECRRGSLTRRLPLCVRRQAALLPVSRPPVR